MTATRQKEQARCPMCGGAARHAFDARDRNRETTAERFPYHRCARCRTVFLAPVPADLASYYEDGYYQFDADGQPSWKVVPALAHAARYRVELIRRHLPAPGHAIEIGAGTGAFAVAAADAGFHVSAIEMSERCCRYLSEQDGIEATCSDRPLAALGELEPADAVVLWHVIEHLPDPAEVIERAAGKLKPGGVVAIATPNPTSIQFRLLHRRWMHLDAPRHLCLIAPDTLVSKAEQAGLRLLATTTTDPNGLECNLTGWISALRRRPADGSAPWLTGHAGGVLSRLLAPIEHSGNRGSAVTVILQRQS